MSKSRNNALQFSSVGSHVLRGGETANGKFGAIQCLTETGFSTITSANIEDQYNHLSTYPIPAGTVLYGEFTEVEVNNGFVICHKY